jgi:hypothetical protein
MQTTTEHPSARKHGSHGQQPTPVEGMPAPAKARRIGVEKQRRDCNVRLYEFYQCVVCMEGSAHANRLDDRPAQVLAVSSRLIAMQLDMAEAHLGCGIEDFRA